MPKRRNISKHYPEKDEKTYQNLIEMVGESLDVLPPSPQKPRQQEESPSSQLPPLSIPFSPEFSDLPPPPSIGPPPSQSNNTVPGNLFEQLSGPNSSAISSSLFAQPAPLTVRDGGGGFSHHQGNNHMAGGGLFSAPYPQQQPMGQGNQPLLSDPSIIGIGLLPNPQTTNIRPLLPPAFFARQPFQNQPTANFNNSHLFLPQLTSTTMTSPHTSSSSSSTKKSHSLLKQQISTSEPCKSTRSKYNNDSWLILMRGLPGSGKSYRAKEFTKDSGIVLSTDEYFMKNGRYDFKPSKLADAHIWNQNRAKRSMEKMVTPVVIDNTNLEMWQMKPYVSLARKAKYQVDICEMDTEWCFKPSELARRNSHGVNKEAIERLLDRYQRHVTVESLMAMLLPPGERDQLNSSKVDSPTLSPRRDHQQPNRSSDTPIPVPRPRQNSHSRRPSIDKVETSLGDLYFDRNYKTPKEAFGVESSGGSQHAGSSPTDAQYISPSGGAVRRTTNNNNHTQHERKNDTPSKDATPTSSSSKDDSAIVRDSKGKVLTPKQLQIRQNLHSSFPTVDKDALDNVLESVSFNLEAASNFIRNSGVQEEQPVVVTKSSKHSSSSSKSKKTNKSNNSSSDTPTTLTSSTTSDDRDFCADPPPDVKRTVTTTSATSASDSILSPRSKGKLEEIIDSYRPSGTESSAVASGSSTLLSGVSDATAGAVSPTASVVSTKCYQEDLKNFNDSNLEFLYEAFPDLKQEYCKMWLRRYNGDLVKTCDYLTRVSQVELPQHEDDDVVELDAEDIEMIDLTQDVEDGDDDDVIVEEDGEQVGHSGTSKQKKKKTKAGEIFLYQDNDDKNAQGGEGGGKEDVRVAIDKSFALEMKKRFGQEDDFDDGDLQYDDFVFDLTTEAAKQVYQAWTNNLRVRKRKLDSIDKDEELAKRLQEEENKNRHTPSKQQAKKMRTLELDTKFTKDKQPAQLAVSSSSKSPWKKMDDNHLTPVEGIGGGQLTLAQVNSREELHTMFPGANEEALDQLLEATNYNLETAAKLVTSSTGAERNDNLQNDLNDSAWKKVISPPRKARASTSQENGAGPVIAISDDDGHYQNTQEDNVSYADLRAEAELYGQLRRDCLQKAAQAFQAKNGSVAQHHANEAKAHEERMNDAHFRAAELMLKRRNEKYMTKQDTIDLHGLHTREALHALINFLDNAHRLKHKYVMVITGRGNHSKNGFSAIRNKVIGYLAQHQYKFTMECNGGAIKVRM